MKFHPILFSTEMVQAILEGRKTQTRRTKGLDGINKKPNDYRFNRLTNTIDFNANGLDIDNFIFLDNSINTECVIVKCPFGKIGDVLWVRETLYQNGELALEYDADCEDIDSEIIPSDFKVKIDKHGNYKFCKIPSIYMPKWACRIFLKIKSIKVERLQDISEENSRKEGVKHLIPNWKDYTEKAPYHYTAYGSFKSLWCSINTEKTWKANPWVWVIEFERIDKPENFE